MIRRLIALAALAVLAPATALAAGHSFQTAGPHLGFSSSPGQVVFGGQMEFGDVAPQLDFVPGIDAGFGDHVTLISLNGDFHYRIALQNSTWQPYAGAGISLHFLSFDNAGPGVDNSETIGGGSLIVGADVPTQSGNRFFAEAKFGLGDADGPAFKALAGWHFRMR